MNLRRNVTLIITAVILLATTALLFNHYKQHARLEYMRQQAEAGVLADQLALGDKYLSAGDLKQSVYWFSKAAQQDSRQAVNQLGIIAYHLQSKDASAADKALSAEVEAQIKAARKPESVVDIYQRRADGGDSDALIAAALIYRRGDGVAQDFAKARGYFERYTKMAQVADPGRGEYYLGFMALKGEGEAVNEAGALALFEKSCRLHYQSACLALGDLYYQGGSTFAPDYKKPTALLDVYSPDREPDSRAVAWLDPLLTMYREGGHGIGKNPARVKQLAQQLCPLGYLDGETCGG